MKLNIYQFKRNRVRQEKTCAEVKIYCNFILVFFCFVLFVCFVSWWYEVPEEANLDFRKLQVGSVKAFPKIITVKCIADAMQFWS